MAPALLRGGPWGNLGGMRVLDRQDRRQRLVFETTYSAEADLAGWKIPRG